MWTCKKSTLDDKTTHMFAAFSFCEHIWPQWKLWVCCALTLCSSASWSVSAYMDMFLMQPCWKNLKAHMVKMCGHVRAAAAHSFLLQWHTCATYIIILNYATALIFAVSNYSVPCMHARSMRASPCAYANMPSWHGAQVSVYTFKHMPCYLSNTAIYHDGIYSTGLLCVMHAWK